MSNENKISNVYDFVKLSVDGRSKNHQLKSRRRFLQGLTAKARLPQEILTWQIQLNSATHQIRV